MIIVLTPGQRAEVSGLLDVCADDEANGDRAEGSAWARLDGSTLTVLDPAETRAELEHRARWLVEVGAEHDEAKQGAALARSLRKLADKIN